MSTEFSRLSNRKAGVIKNLCGCSLMVEPQPSKLTTRVRFPSSAPYVKFVELEIVRFFLFIMYTIDYKCKR